MKTIKQISTNEMNLSFVLLELNDPIEMDNYYKLFIECFGERSNINLSTFYWFNLKSPLYENLIFALLDRENNKLICAYGLLPGDATVDSKILKYALCTNVMTHPDYVGKGLFKLIGIESLEFVKKLGLSFCFGVPNEQATRGHLRVGWEIVNEINFYELKTSTIVSDKLSERVKINYLTKLSDIFYINLYNNKYKFFINRTAQWMNWRISKPNSEYIDLVINEKDARAFLVLKKFTDTKNDLKKLHIIDFGYSDENTFKELLRHAQYLAKNEKFDLINLWEYNFNIQEVALLSNLGFIETENVNPIIVHKLGNEIDLPTTDWHVTLFDNDVY